MRLPCSGCRVIAVGQFVPRVEGLLLPEPGNAIALAIGTSREFARIGHDIMPLMLPDLQLDDVVRLRKPHPCGGNDWKIVRLGADIGLECLQCGRRVLLPRRTLARRLKIILPKADNAQNLS